ncbi:MULTISPECIES: PD-(D/E)XK nuclease family protein [Winogradskyella]|uniref:PDDEXK-like family protein n=1 Tax=Winogradskyella TaxID=286104 RepID=UPI0015C9F3E0|nr:MULTISPECIES: PD-(D/E)XK nuclease family protein [Winogradskyella]QXP78307.1 PD-(D/E)XK nuclease family protein [Winogradskyella sp. HaHa_3_26]
MNQSKLETLLSSSRHVVETHRKATKEKGEDFNIFSVLGMESDETKTHSGMLVALLDPKGNHYYDTQFLELFLKEIEYDYEGEDLNLVRVKAEHHLGTISKDYESGGFIDILITFPLSDRTITIENKIYAGDQPKQMYRYSLFNKGKSTLYYLNLFGRQPSKKSLKTLSKDDYQIITYSNEILNWLEECIEVVKPGSIIETSLKQYQILLKKLTHTMDDNLEAQFNTLIINNLEEAKYIHAHYQKAVNNIKEKLRLAVSSKLETLKLPLDVKLGNDSSHNYSQIWLNNPVALDDDFSFGIESFSGHGNNEGRMFVGIFDNKNEYDCLIEGDTRLNSYWPVIRNIKTPSGNPLNLSSTITLEKLSSDSLYFEEMVSAVVKQTAAFIESYQDYCLKKQGL